MNRRIRYSGVPAGNPLVNALMVIVGALAVGAMIVLGIVAFLVVASIIIILAGIIGIRVWWHRRKWRHASGVTESERRESGERVIEGEYRRVSTRNDREGKEPD